MRAILICIAHGAQAKRSRFIFSGNVIISSHILSDTDLMKIYLNINN